MTPTRQLSISIDRPAAEAYEFLAQPENFPKWASGLGKSLRRADGKWIAETPEGPATVHFSERNSAGVLDHSVRLPSGMKVEVPLRVVPKGNGCELVLTLIRLPGMSDEKFAADAEWIMRDLATARRLLESEASMKPNPAPGYKKYPGHRVSTQPSAAHVQVTYKGEVIADTRDAVELHESMSSSSVLAPVVYYIPRKDVKMDRLTRTSHTTHCPFKGDASYFSLRDGPENAVWSYEQPYDEMLAIKDRVAFYPDKVSISSA